MVDLSRVQLVLTDLGEMEDAIFKQRRDDEVLIDYMTVHVQHIVLLMCRDSILYDCLVVCR